jgi:hypothetical protein
LNTTFQQSFLKCYCGVNKIFPLSIKKLFPFKNRQVFLMHPVLGGPQCPTIQQNIGNQLPNDTASSFKTSTLQQHCCKNLSPHKTQHLEWDASGARVEDSHFIAIHSSRKYLQFKHRQTQTQTYYLRWLRQTPELNFMWKETLWGSYL